MTSQHPTDFFGVNGLDPDGKDQQTAALVSILPDLHDVLCPFSSAIFEPTQYLKGAEELRRRMEEAQGLAAKQEHQIERLNMDRVEQRRRAERAEARLALLGEDI